MEHKKILIFIFTSILFLSFSCIYADGGPPPLNEKTARSIAQDYLESNNLPYTALTPTHSEMKIKVKVKSTGKSKWISMDTLNEILNQKPGDEEIYEFYDSYSFVYVVKVVDKNGAYKGNIYVNAESGAIRLVNVEKAPIVVNNTSSNNTTNNTTADSNKPEGFLGAIMDFIQNIITFFQQYWMAITSNNG